MQGPESWRSTPISLPASRTGRSTPVTPTRSQSAFGNTGSKAFPGFTATYGVMMLVWYEVHDSREGAFRRERQIKKWNRAWKIRLILELNPGWLDLYESLNQ